MDRLPSTMEDCLKFCVFENIFCCVWTGVMTFVTFGQDREFRAEKVWCRLNPANLESFLEALFSLCKGFYSTEPIDKVTIEDGQLQLQLSLSSDRELTISCGRDKMTMLKVNGEGNYLNFCKTLWHLSFETFGFSLEDQNIISQLCTTVNNQIGSVCCDDLIEAWETSSVECQEKKSILSFCRSRRDVLKCNQFVSIHLSRMKIIWKFYTVLFAHKASSAD